jgi:DNA gyrase/topoisomerase IV subunit A
MIRKSDVQWWVLEAKKHPESAPTIIEELAKRLAELDAENEHLRDEIIRLQRRAPAAAPRAEVQVLQRKVETLQSLLDGEKSTELSAVFLSDRLQSARLLLSQAQQMARQGHPVLDKRALLGLRCLLLARPHDDLLLLTSQGRGLKAPLSDVPILAEGGNWPTAEGQGLAPQGNSGLALRRSSGPALRQSSWLASGEQLAAALAVAEPPRFWTVATRRGYVQRFVRVAFDRRLAQGERLVRSPLRNDAPVAIVDGDRGDVLLITRWGKGVRFSHRAIEGQGSVALDLEPDDEVVAALSLPTDVEILIVTAGGYGARRDTTRFSSRSRPGGAGRALIQAHDVLAAFPYSASARLLYLTYSGKLAFVSVRDLPPQERVGKGTPLRDMSRDPAVAVVLVLEELLQ